MNNPRENGVSSSMSLRRKAAWLALAVSIVVIGGLSLTPIMGSLTAATPHNSPAGGSPSPSTNPQPDSHLQQNWDKSGYGATPQTGCTGAPSGVNCYPLGTVLTWAATLSVCTSSTTLCGPSTTPVTIVMFNATALLQPGETYVSGTETATTIPAATPSFATGLCSAPSHPTDCDLVSPSFTWLNWNFTPAVTLNGLPQANFTYKTTLTGSGTLDDTDVAHYSVQTLSENPPVSAAVYVPKNTTLVTTSVSPSSITLGSSETPSASDTATLSGGYDPTGSITFYVYYSATSTPSCTGTPVFTSSPVSVDGNGAYSSPAYTPSEVGYYFWTANYTGDANNTGYTTSCGASGETLTVSPATPSISTLVSPQSLVLGGSAQDTATLSGGYDPTGTITFYAYYSSTSTPSCSGTPVFTSSPVTVDGNGDYLSGLFTPSEVGYYFWIASYSGDANNMGYTTSCGASGETLDVTPAILEITTDVSPASILLGSAPYSANDTATITGGYSPTGTITFYVYFSSSSAPVCSDQVWVSEAITVEGDGSYVSGPFTPTEVGYYFWMADYSGDANNEPYTTDCGAAGETLTVTSPTLMITTEVSPSTIMLSGSQTPSAVDTATLSGGFSPTGTLVFYVYYNATSTPNCSDLVFTSTAVTVNGDGQYNSSAFTPSVAGYYFWTVAYSGDANNPANTTTCGAPGETLYVYVCEGSGVPAELGVVTRSG